MGNSVGGDVASGTGGGVSVGTLVGLSVITGLLSLVGVAVDAAIVGRGVGGLTGAIVEFGVAKGARVGRGVAGVFVGKSSRQYARQENE